MTLVDDFFEHHTRVENEDSLSNINSRFSSAKLAGLVFFFPLQGKVHDVTRHVSTFSIIFFH